ncbi:MAG TPA: cytochrome P450 [Amycolatopsis sp.]|uniref:cytochrome P450 n=1 Tax=Amycolatopsis sp. TaxID=37632 RepID=UPI002B4797B4|nr:cytochrome P450 [Amycolatopsis sp.]HKS46597.1 cytochrome P450 [Amycolatopsis sp.]
MADPRTDDLLDASRVDMPIVPAPVDCMPSVLAAGRVAPVVKVDYYGGTVWDVCDTELARMALADRRLSKDIELAPDWMRIPGEFSGSLPSPEVARIMLMSEGAEHARIRRAHARIFTPRNAAKWAARLTRLADELLDGLAAEAFAGGGEVNLVERYVDPIPLGFLCEMLGLRPERHAEMKHLTDDIIYSPDQAARAGGVGALARAVAGWASDPSSLNEGVITGLLHEVDGEAVVTVDEVVTWTFGLVLAGYQSTASLLSSAIFEALRRPAGRRPRGETQIEAWIEEALRAHPPATHATWRFAAENLDLGGYFIPQGAPVQINIAAANRCPHGELADDFDPGASRDHVSFGLGRHYCLGAPLARVETRIALGAFLSRFPNARLSETTAVGWESDWMNRRISVLPVVLAAITQPDHERLDERD